ncbi:MAG TPA: tyrosine-type recombinase/integrase [Acidisarcina sp.]|nr:tyrosine-type recombinase/integrase [Acidisarcina sp.]
MSISAGSLFEVAAQCWLQSRSITDVRPGALSARYIRERTAEDYGQYIASLTLFFGGMQLGEIGMENIIAYQQARVRGAEPFIRYRRPQDAKPRRVGGVEVPARGKTSCPAKAKKVRQELGLLIHLLQQVDCWTDQMREIYEMHTLIDDDEQDIPRALTPEEQQHWLDVSRLQTRWDIVYWYSLLAFSTCMSTDELRGLRLGDVNLFQRVLVVPRKSAKNIHRARTIELVGADVLWALERLLERARMLGARDMGHYLFPRRNSSIDWDPTAPMSESGIKRQWNEVRSTSRLTWFRCYDCRHTAITRLAEAGVPIDIIMARAGHVSEKMRRHYTHISSAAQRRWMEHANGFHRLAPEAPSQPNPYQGFAPSPVRPAPVRVANFSAQK